MKKWIPLIILAGLIGAAYAAGLHHYISLEQLQDQKDSFQTYTATHPVLSASIFVGLYSAAVALSLPIATLMTLLGGFLFGKLLGTFFVVVAATIGATIIFVVAKTSLGETLRGKAGALYQKISKNMEDNAVGYMLFMRLVPLFPFVLVNIVPALFNVRLRDFVLTTFFGIIPGTFVYVNVGETLGEIDSLNDLVSVQTLIAFGLLGVFALIPTLYKQIKARKSSALVAITILMIAAPAHASDHSKFITFYDGLLRDHVRVTQKNDVSYNGVDYAAWAQDDRHKDALTRLQSIETNSFREREEKLAFWINAYNFLTIELIISMNETESIKNLGGFFQSPWKHYSWAIGGKEYSLDNIEHGILRMMDEPRIHFAINCASISCPDLHGKAYTKKRLDKQLKKQVEATLSNTAKGFRFDENSNVLYVSKLMSWFRSDFNNGDLKSWLKTYRPDIIAKDPSIRFIEYDWSLNSVMGRDNG